MLFYLAIRWKNRLTDALKDNCEVKVMEHLDYMHSHYSRSLYKKSVTQYNAVYL